MKELLKELKEDIKLCEFDDGLGHDNKDMIQEALVTFDNLENQMRRDNLFDHKFDLTDIIQFGYYVRNNPNVTMRENYLNWKEIAKNI